MVRYDDDVIFEAERASVIQSRTGRCVVFDLDDTLYDEIDYVRSGFRAVAIAVRADTTPTATRSCSIESTRAS